jgi:interleukin enhancer-binding factor 2
MITGNNIADIVVILKTLPTREAVESLSKKVEEDLKNVMKTEVVTKADAITFQLTDKGFDIFNWQARVKILIATLPQNIRKLEPETHLDVKMMQLALSAIRHSRWFEENSTHSSIKVLIRVLRDLTTRFEAFTPLNTWMIDLLAHFVIMNNPSRQALPINWAFRRVFQLLAAGLFLPGSSGISDPCEVGHIRIHTALTLEQQDALCMTSQTLLRVLNHGGAKAILGFDKKENLITEISVWDNVVLNTLSLAYEKSEKKENEDEDRLEDMETEMNEEME